MTAGDRNGSNKFEIPDLDLPPPRASQSSLKAATPPDGGRIPSSGSGRIASPAIEEALEASLSGAPLALELEGPISAAGVTVARSVSQEQRFESEGFELESVKAPPLPGLMVAPEGHANWPMGTTVARDQLRLDPVEVRLLAGFGEPPRFGPLSALYAARVTLRKNSLKIALRGVEQELSLAERARDALLAELAQRKLVEIERSEAFRRVLSALSEVDGLARERGHALSSTSAEHAAEVAGLDAELSRVRAELEAERSAQRELGAVLETREQTLRRVDARYKRYFIEMRALEQRAAQLLGPSGGEMPADLRKEWAPLQAGAEALKPELEGAKGACEGARAELEARRKTERELEQQAREIERQQAQLRDRYQQQVGVRERGLGEAAAQRQLALADVGRAILASRGGVNVDEPTLESLRQADQKVLLLAKKSELHVVALDSCDDASVKSGFAWLLGAFALLVGYLCYRWA